MEEVYIENSSEPDLEGEESIDVAENYRNGRTILCQLKHSTNRLDSAFSFSEIQKTIVDFANRFKANPEVEFLFVSNRRVSDEITKGIHDLSDDPRSNHVGAKKIRAATQLEGTSLQTFCANFFVNDKEENFHIQKFQLTSEAGCFIAGRIDSGEIANLVDLIAERAEPGHKDSPINQAHLLERFGISDENQLFPAPPEVEEPPQVLRRYQHDEIARHVLFTNQKTILHAAGGIGKTVVAKSLKDSMPEGSVGIYFDCFGGGSYKNPSKPRHLARHGLVQIMNEMARASLCNFFLPRNSDHEEQIFRAFRKRMQEAIAYIRHQNENGKLLIIIDAADNAESIATAKGADSFPKLLLRENFPENVHLLLTSRTERKEKLAPPSSVSEIELEGFEEGETAKHLKLFFPESSANDVAEFHRLSSKNPRVQAIAMRQGHESVDQLLSSLGEGVTVDEQIGLQLKRAIAKIKDAYPDAEQAQIDQICIALANLPPLIPLNVLSLVSDVNEAAILSFVSELGLPLRHTDDAIQFRDEPTETWFQQNYEEGPNGLSNYVEKLKFASSTSGYISRCLPQLLLRAGRIDSLVELASSDAGLPAENEVEAKEVRIFRLQFALQACLKTKMIFNAVKLAMRMGEEISGNRRHSEVLLYNTHLLSTIYCQSQIQEIAYRRKIESDMKGSSCIFSASLLSTHSALFGDARNYLRQGLNWLDVEIENLRNQSTDRGFPHREPINEISEICWTIFNISSPENTIEFIDEWRNAQLRERLASSLTTRLIDLNRLSDLDKFAQSAVGNPRIFFSICKVAFENGLPLSSTTLFKVSQGLSFISSLKYQRKGRPSSSKPLRTKNSKGRHRIRRTKLSSNFPRVPVTVLRENESIQILENLARSGSWVIALQVLQFQEKSKIFSARAPLKMGSMLERKSLKYFLRRTALKSVLTGQKLPSTNLLIRAVSRSISSQGEDLEFLTKALKYLLPFYRFRALQLIRKQGLSPDEIQAIISSFSSHSSYYWQEREIDGMKFRVFLQGLLFDTSPSIEKKDWARKPLLDLVESAPISDMIVAVGTLARSSAWSDLAVIFETRANNGIRALRGEEASERIEMLVDLSKAVVPFGSRESAFYFEEALKETMRFGQENWERWKATLSLSKRASETQSRDPELCYRLLRVSEFLPDSSFASETISTAVSFHPEGAIAMASRWRDRNCTESYSLNLLLLELAKRKLAHQGVLLSFTGFRNVNSSSLLKEFFSSEAGENLMGAAVDFASRDLALIRSRTEESEEIRKIVGHSVELLQIVESHIGPPSAKGGQQASTSAEFLSRREKEAQIRRDGHIEKVSRLNLMTAKDALDFFESEKGVDSHFDWSVVFSRIRRQDAPLFAKEFLDDPRVSVLQGKSLLDFARESWGEWKSIRLIWSDLVSEFGRRFAEDIPYQLTYYMLNWGSDEETSLKAGIVEGLSSVDQFTSSTLFSFVSAFSGDLELENAKEITSDSLSRFEAEIDEDEFGDGLWCTTLAPPDGVPHCLASFVWAALASPLASERWDACHVILRLCKLECFEVIAEIWRIWTNGISGAFVGRNFPFYDLHAKLYLMIASLRVVSENSRLSSNSLNRFKEIALGDLEHVLIRRFAADVALTLNSNGLVSESFQVQKELQMVGVSKLPAVEKDYKVGPGDSPWHEKDAPLMRESSFHFEYDFDRYWFGRLQDIFNVKRDQLEDKGRSLLDERMGIESDFTADPRQQVLNEYYQSDKRASFDRDGSFRRMDSWRFYLSFHSVFWTADQLLNSMRVSVTTYDDGVTNEWEEWFGRRRLTRNDGFWISDRRDPVPERQRLTFQGDYSSGEWDRELCEDDGWDVIQNCGVDSSFVPVYASMYDHEYGRIENIDVKSALVSPKTARSLQLAIQNSGKYDCMIPLQDGDNEISAKEFSLKGWISDKTRESQIDEMDERSAGMTFREIDICESLKSLLNLNSDRDRRIWEDAEKNVALRCEIWKEQFQGQLYRPQKEGFRLSASLDTLRSICSTQGMDFLIQVDVSRSVSRESHGEERAERWKRVVFLISNDGRISTSERSNKAW